MSAPRRSSGGGTGRARTSAPAKKRGSRRTSRHGIFRRTSDPGDPKPRLIALLLGILIIGAGFVAQLIDLQAGPSGRAAELRAQGEVQRTIYRELAGYRGSVVDRSGFVFAASTPSHEVVADPQIIQDPEETARLLAPILERDVASLVEDLRGESESDRYELLGRGVGSAGKDRIQELRDDDDTSIAMVGITLQPQEARIYPAAELATPIIGRVDPHNNAIYGIENQYDDFIAGTPGQMEFEASRFGSISVADWKVDPAKPGFDVVLAIDHRIQFMAEEALRKQCEKTAAAGATAVVSDPRTGEILAMAGVARDENGTCAVPRHNPALVWSFEPGSVMKTITMAAAIEELGWSQGTEIDVPPQLVVGDKTFVDHPPHPTAPYTLRQILADSMNVGTIRVGQSVGPAQVHSYLERFGFGQLTGIDFNGETAGSVRALDDWWGSDVGSIPIGQGVTVNATQLAAAYNVVAAEGMYRRPVLVTSLRDPDGTVHAIDTGPGKPVVSERTAHELTSMLTEVVESGTGRPAAIDGYAVAGKTGTAWKLFENEDGKSTYGSNGNRRYVSTFAGFAPADDPRLTVVVVIDEPTAGPTTASAVAAPVFSEIGGFALRTLGVAPQMVVGRDDPMAGPVRAAPASGIALEDADRPPADQGLEQ